MTMISHIFTIYVTFFPFLFCSLQRYIRFQNIPTLKLDDSSKFLVYFIKIARDGKRVTLFSLLWIACYLFLFTHFSLELHIDHILLSFKKQQNEHILLWKLLACTIFYFRSNTFSVIHSTFSLQTTE